MARPSDRVDVYLEIGQKRVFAGALDWPGWCRSGRDESSALQALFETGPRYARVLESTGLGFQAPAEASALVVVERLKGTATTDFGAPDIAPSSDTRPLDASDLRRFETLLSACWRAFDAAARAAEGRELRKGPRGGGRDVARIIEHVLGADAGYLSGLGRKHRSSEGSDWNEALSQTRQVILEALAAAASGQTEAHGPRGGLRWSPRYYVRRVAWHVLDHTWEIEDRIQAA